MVKQSERFKGKGLRKCKLCGNARALIREHDIYVCRRCFREVARDLGFRKYG